MPGNRNRRAAENPAFSRLCGIGRGGWPHGFQDRTLQPLGYISNCVYSNHHPSKVMQKRREMMERNRLYFAFFDSRKSLEILNFSDGRFQNGIPISRPPRYDRFGNPPCASGLYTKSAGIASGRGFFLQKGCSSTKKYGTFNIQIRKARRSSWIRGRREEKNM